LRVVCANASPYFSVTKTRETAGKYVLALNIGNVKMATAVTNSLSVVNFADLVRSVYADFKIARAKRAKYFETVRELESLDSRGLNDLGIARCDIDRLAHEHVYGA